MIKNLKTLREKHHISQTALAEAIGISQQSVNKYENSSTEPDIATLISIADYFNTSVDYLIGHTDIDHKIEPVFDYQLNEQELSVMDNFRSLNESTKNLAEQLFSALKNKERS